MNPFMQIDIFPTFKKEKKKKNVDKLDDVGFC